MLLLFTQLLPITTAPGDLTELHKGLALCKKKIHCTGIWGAGSVVWWVKQLPEMPTSHMGTGSNPWLLYF